MAQLSESYKADPVTVGEVPKREGWKLSGTPSANVAAVFASHEGGKDGGRITSRRFDAIDEYVHHKFTALFLKQIHENPDRKIRILDFGGGLNSRCVRDILRCPAFKGKVHAINVDLFAKPLNDEQLIADGIDPDDITVVNGDVVECDIPDGSIDAIISFQALEWIHDMEKMKAVLDKAAALLAPGGEAYLDERWRLTRGTEMGGWIILPSYMPGERATYWLNEIAQKHRVAIRPTHHEVQLDGRAHFMGSGNGMIWMGKEREGILPRMNAFEAVMDEVRAALKETAEL